MQIIRGKIATAQRVVIYGPPGIGKTTLASQFPNPLFIDTEGGTFHLDIARTPPPSSWAMLLQQVQYVRNNPDICDTLIIDTADWAEHLCTVAVCAEKQWDGIEAPGWGKGYQYLAESFGRLLNLLSDVIERGIHVVFTAHAEIKRFELPEENGSYDRWQLKLGKQSTALLIEWAEMILFATYKIYVTNVDNQGARKGKNKATGGKRVMYTDHHPTFHAKNRHGLPMEIDLDYASIAHVFLPKAQLQTPTGKLIVPTPAAPSAAPSPAREQTVSTFAPTPTPTPAPVIDTPEPAPTAIPPQDELAAAGVPKALADLMRTSGVTLDELMAAVHVRKYFPADTEFGALPEDFIQGALIAAWPQVLQVIETEVRAPF